MDEQKDLKFNVPEEEPFDETTDSLTEEEYLAAQAYSETIRQGTEQKPEKGNWLREFFEWTQAIAVAVVLALLINQFIFALVQVEGSSMQPTLQSKERLVITKLFYQPKAKDIIVVKSHALGKHIIKRIIALPGDTIDIHPETGDVIVNGEVLSEPYIKEKLRSIGTVYQYPFEVPEGYVFVMGDNRNNSQDSRTLGVIAFEDIVGRASFRVMPFSQFGTLYKNLD